MKILNSMLTGGFVTVSATAQTSVMLLLITFNKTSFT